MEWEFTPQQVVKGEAGYGLDEFRHDLMQEVGLNIPGLGQEQLEPVFSLAYDLCYWLATGKDYDEFEERFQDNNTVMFLRALREHGKANVEMLGAILQRMIMDGVEAGLSVDDAVDRVAAHQSELVRQGGVTLG
ncbi:hypothetical protein SKTS_22910 [Sulfurimicrobium lacus]|uniref:Uncharacterized protein n=1 Tax=Sulfurimicrobium lacus TaxID=2715678 RepID=A0A6F8VF67_9PROT|nr:hypothetical protein [Sulfurimicrobium lacus]BCB27405.1 hypothetical protein SKTS_22910 [Sulfurimicrobium lacus]